MFGEPDPARIPAAVKPYKRILLFKQGDLSQAVRDALRRGGNPMALGEMVVAVTAQIGASRAAIPAMRHWVRASLQYLPGLGKVAKAGRGSRVTWALSA